MQSQVTLYHFFLLKTDQLQCSYQPLYRQQDFAQPQLEGYIFSIMYRFKRKKWVEKNLLFCVSSIPLYTLQKLPRNMQ